MKKKTYTRPLGVVLDEELFDQLIEYTDRKQLSKSEFIRRLIEDYFIKQHTHTESSKPKSGSGIQKSKVSTKNITI
jgi:hypothetical protein